MKFIQICVVELHPYCCVIFRCMGIPQFRYPFYCKGTGLFPFGAIVNKGVVIILVPIFGAHTHMFLAGR